MNRRGRKTDSKAMVTRILDTLIENAVNHSKIVATEIIDNILKGAVIPLEAANMHSVHCKYGILFFSPLHSHGNFSFQVTKVLSVTDSFIFMYKCSCVIKPYRMISVA
jgi:hypothetical protein